MACIAKEVETELLPFLRVYKDGYVERLLGSQYVPPLLDDPETGVSSKDITISQDPLIKARVFLPKLDEPHQKLPVLIYYHGGGFCVESAFSSDHHRYLDGLVSQAKVVAVSVEYRMAPEHCLPAAYEDGWAALQWVASHFAENVIDDEPWLTNHGNSERFFLGGDNFDRLYIGGDSARGIIGHNLVMRAGVERLCGGVKILGAYLGNPFFWSSKPIGSEPKGEDFEKNPIRKFWDFVYPSAPGGIDNPMVNPGGDGAPSLAGLTCSRLLVCVAGKDKLRDRGEVELFEVEGEDHCFHFQPEIDPDSENVKKVFKRLVSFLV
ncbi:2-hydroxyisoflavanone dehydratase-like [Pyrus ussuriensis x Pyrus communis]|uniref:2-hydroxyisoflavanone dehydratase-like n=1 Tax=Pyrus ussuriensis x Pyrus communis TaxID=2448454 RepID=A0A5N5HEM8_9ROSA|nr:2-hydroxyisoflavanone dehydratase-like [Pyrus ussuriensis x Pyrus communis]